MFFLKVLKTIFVTKDHLVWKYCTSKCQNPRSYKRKLSPAYCCDDSCGRKQTQLMHNIMSFQLLHLLISEVWKSDAVLYKYSVIFGSHYERPKIKNGSNFLYSWHVSECFFSCPVSHTVKCRLFKKSIFLESNKAMCLYLFILLFHLQLLPVFYVKLNSIVKVLFHSAY